MSLIGRSGIFFSLGANGLEGVRESSTPLNLATLPFFLSKHMTQLHSTPSNISSTPPKTWSNSRGAPPKCGAGGVGEYYPPATDYTLLVTVRSPKKVHAAPPLRSPYPTELLGLPRRRCPSGLPRRCRQASSSHAAAVLASGGAVAG